MKYQILLNHIFLTINDLADVVKSTAIISVIVAIILLLVTRNSNGSKDMGIIKSFFVLVIGVFILVFILRGCMDSDTSVISTPSRR